MVQRARENRKVSVKNKINMDSNCPILIDPNIFNTILNKIQVQVHNAVKK